MPRHIAHAARVRRRLRAAVTKALAVVKVANAMARPLAHRKGGVNVFAADNDDKARRLFRSAQQQFTNLIRGMPGKLPPPTDNIDAYWTAAEKAQTSAMLTNSCVGSPETVNYGSKKIIKQTGVDQVIVFSAIYDHGARLRPYELLSDIFAQAS